MSDSNEIRLEELSILEPYCQCQWCISTDLITFLVPPDQYKCLTGDLWDQMHIERARNARKRGYIPLTMFDRIWNILILSFILALIPVLAFSYIDVFRDAFFFWIRFFSHLV